MTNKRHKHQKPAPHNPQDKNSVQAFLDEEICIEAKLTVNPEVSIGEIKVECIESEIEPATSKHASDECTMVVTQLVRVKIPVRFKAKVEADEQGIGCIYNQYESSSYLDDYYDY